MQINLWYDAAGLAAPQSFRDGMQAAADLIEKAFIDNIVVNISVEYGSIGGAPLDANTSKGGPAGDELTYAVLRSGLSDGATSVDDFVSVASLPQTTTLQGHDLLFISRAQQKAFGLIAADDATIDGSVGMGTGFTGNVLFAGALHEITHAMGRLNGTSLDVFRYSSPGFHVWDADPTPAYFSIDFGVTNLAAFGIDSDPGDFLNPTLPGALYYDAFNETVSDSDPGLSAIDLTIMDVLGFHRSPTFIAGDGLGNVPFHTIFDDTIYGLEGNDTLDGGAGADVLRGGSGDDKFVGSPDGATDFWLGGPGSDSYFVSEHEKIIEFSSDGGTDTVYSPISWILENNVENLRLIGTNNIDGTGNSSGNNIFGNAGNNVLDGKGGFDVLAGGDGDDTYYLGALGPFWNTITENPNEGEDTVYIPSNLGPHSYTLTANVEHGLVSGGTNFDLVGNALANRLTGNAADNVLTGGAGDDTLTGGIGDDTLDGGDGVDTVFLPGALADYAIVHNPDGSTTVTDLWNSFLSQGVDTLIDVEKLSIGGVIYSNPPNTQPPVATSGSTAGAEDTLISGQVTASDPEGAVLNYAVIAGPAHGTLSFNPSGSFVYTPNANYNGADSFTFTANDGQFDSGVGAQSLTIAAVNDAAVITGQHAGAVTEAADLSTVSTVSGTLAATDIDSSTSFSVFAQGAFGSVAITAAGAWIYTLDNTNPTVDGLSAGDAPLPDTVTVQTSDGTLQAISITISGANDLRLGGGGADSLLGSSGVDTLNGAAGADTLAAGGGADLLIGGAGPDKLDGGAGSDTASYANSASGVNVNLATGAGSGGDAQGDTLTGVENLAGTAFNDTLIGDAQDNILAGGDGKDVLDGGAGIDTASYEGVSSAIFANLATGKVKNITGEGKDNLTNIENLTGSAFSDQLTGDGGGNVLKGGGGADTLTGAGGADTVAGGAGADRYVFMTTADSPTGAQDTILDFSHADGDRIDLSAIDAITGKVDNAFTLVAALTHVAGQLTAAFTVDHYLVQGDVNGDGVADFAFNVYSSTALVSGDFIM